MGSAAPSSKATFARHESFGDCRRRIESAGTVIRDTQLAASARLPRHRHEEPYLCITLHGHYTELNGVEIACEQGSVLAHPAGHQHSNRTGTSGARCVNVEFSESLVADAALKALVASNRLVQLPPSHVALRGLSHALNLADDTAGLSVLTATLGVVCAALQLEQRVVGRPPWLASVVSLMEADLAHTPSLDRLANVAGVHPSHLSRTFRSVHGESIGAYLRRRRLERADAELADASRSLADLAIQAGFFDQAHFTRAYTRHFGITPGTRRKVGRS